MKIEDRLTEEYRSFHGDPPYNKRVAGKYYRDLGLLMIVAKIEMIYEVLPEYWAIWKNRFGQWSIGEVRNEGMFASEVFSSIDDLHRWVIEKFKASGSQPERGLTWKQ